MNALARYGSIQNETASRERLMVMLFEAALRHIRNGAAELADQRTRDGLNSVMKASEIVEYLKDTLDHAQAPEIAGNLAAVYTFVCVRLLRGSAQRNPEFVREAERAFAPLVDAFAEAVRMRGAA